MTDYEIDLENEQVIDNHDAAKDIARLSKRDKPLHLNQVRRWQRRGVNGIRLPSVMIGSRRFTSQEAIRWWIQAVTAAANSTKSNGTTCAPTTCAERETLAAAGIA